MATCGRRWGKNVVVAVLVVQTLLEKRGRVAWYSPAYKQQSDDWWYFLDLLHPVIHTKSEVEKLLVVTDGVLEMWSLDSPDVTRGRAYHRGDRG